MKTPLHLLVVEDSPVAAKAEIHYIATHTNYDLQYEIVETHKDMREALTKQEWDAIICDHCLPDDFNSTAAFILYKDLNLDIPFIIVSGMIKDDMACKAMEAGVHDYIMKDNMARLVPALERELKRAKERKMQKEKEAKKQAALEELLESVANSAKKHIERYEEDVL